MKIKFIVVLLLSLHISMISAAQEKKEENESLNKILKDLKNLEKKDSREISDELTKILKDINGKLVEVEKNLEKESKKFGLTMKDVANKLSEKLKNVNSQLTPSKIADEVKKLSQNLASNPFPSIGRDVKQDEIELEDRKLKSLLNQLYKRVQKEEEATAADPTSIKDRDRLRNTLSLIKALSADLKHNEALIYRSDELRNFTREVILHRNSQKEETHLLRTTSITNIILTVMVALLLLSIMIYGGLKLQANTNPEYYPVLRDVEGPRYSKEADV